MEKNCTAKITDMAEAPERRNAASGRNIPLIAGYTPGASTLHVVLKVTYVCIGKCPDSEAAGGFSQCPTGGSIDFSRDIPISDLVSDAQLEALDNAHKAFKSDPNRPSDQGTTHTGSSSQKLLEDLYVGGVADKIKDDLDNKGPFFQELQAELADWNVCKCKITKTVQEKTKMSGMDQDNKNRAYKRNRY